MTNKLSTCEIIKMEVTLKRRNEDALKEICEKEGWEMSETGNIVDTPKILNTQHGG